MTNPRQILYCDDDCDDVEIMKGIFNRIHNAPELIIVGSGTIALDYLREKAEVGGLPCFLLIDINMPVIDGKMLALRIKEDHNLKHLPMAFISTSANQLDKDFALNLGMDFFSKPSSIDKLVKLAEQIVDYAAKPLPSRHLEQLFCKYLNNQCSPPEVKELLSYFTAENESALRALITASLEDMDAEDED